MATWASYSIEQKNQVQDVVNSQRSWEALMAQAAILGSAISSAWNGGTSTLVNNLDEGEIIPNDTGLAGPQGVSKDDVANVAGYAINFSDPDNASQGTGGYNSNFLQALRVKFAGINAVIAK